MGAWLGHLGTLPPGAPIFPYIGVVGVTSGGARRQGCCRILNADIPEPKRREQLQEFVVRDAAQRAWGSARPGCGTCCSSRGWTRGRLISRQAGRCAVVLRPLDRCWWTGLRFALRGVRNAFPRFPSGEATGVDGPCHGQDCRPEGEPQGRLLGVYHAEDGFRRRLRIAAQRGPKRSALRQPPPRSGGRPAKPQRNKLL